MDQMAQQAEEVRLRLLFPPLSFDCCAIITTAQQIRSDQNRIRITYWLILFFEPNKVPVFSLAWQLRRIYEALVFSQQEVRDGGLKCCILWFSREVLSKNYLLPNFRKCTTVVKHTGLDESDESVESENEGATSDNPSDSNTGGGSKGRGILSILFVCFCFLFFCLFLFKLHKCVSILCLTQAL